jgi:hypothetical protein
MGIEKRSLIQNTENKISDNKNVKTKNDFLKLCDNDCSLNANKMLRTAQGTFGMRLTIA